MSELLVLGWNVAVPEVDIGDDIFVVKDKDGSLHRVQVKSANAKPARSGYRVQFKLRLDQLRTPIIPSLHYIFVVRENDKWSHYIIIKQADLNSYFSNTKIGYKDKNHLQLYLHFSSGKLFAGDHDFTKYLNNWDIFSNQNIS